MDTAEILEQDFSESSQTALKYALARAKARLGTRAIGERPQTESRSQIESPAIRSTLPPEALIRPHDLIAGIILSHPKDSEPERLFQYFRIQPDILLSALKLDLNLQPDRQFPDIGMFDADAQSVLAASRALAQQYNQAESGLVRLRDLFGAVLQVPSKARDLLEEETKGAGVPLPEITQAYPDFLNRAFAKTSFTQFLTGRFPAGMGEQPLNVIEPNPGPPLSQLVVSGFATDTRTERDLVGIGYEVDAFAYLIAAKAIDPPLAIGLFGDWGSGKSFFMQSLQRRVHRITVDARMSGRKQSDISVYKSIIQIEFNAWHYVEGELWASLVEHIFHNLHTHPEEDSTLLQERQQHWLNELARVRREQKEVQALKMELKRQQEAKQKEVKTLEKQCKEKLNELNQVKAEDVVRSVALSPEKKAELNDLLTRLGVRPGLDSVIEFEAALSELRTVLARGNGLTTPLRERGWQWTLALIAVVLSGPIISLLLTWFARVQIPEATNALISFSVFLSGLTAMIKLGTSRFGAMVRQVEQAQATLDTERRKTEADYAARLAEKERECAELQARYDQVRYEEQQIGDQITALERELEQTTPQRVLLDFVQSRAGSEDYRKRLGIAALIRRDFEQLSQLIQKQNEEFIKEDKGSVEVNKTLVNRIVLYIDDLDRCPPKRVVEVLQAVHLLLAFPLFVVVVAVDARWLSQSLEKHYENLLGSPALDGAEPSNGRAQPATPQNYLEKIFQIPFWVRPLTSEARVRIVRGLLEKSLVQHAVKEPIRNDSPRGKPGTPDTRTAPDEKFTIVEWSAWEQLRPLDEKAPTQPKPPSLDIQWCELEFMESLKALLGQTPRAVKRFVNLYRLMKAIALPQCPDFAVDGPHAYYKQVLFLLAVLTGLPSISRELFQAVTSASAQPGEAKASGTLELSLQELRTNLHGRRNLPWSMSPKHQTAADETAVSPSADTEQPEGEHRQIQVQELEQLEDWLNRYDQGRWLKLRTDQLATWVPQVARFSFRMEQA